MKFRNILISLIIFISINCRSETNTLPKFVFKLGTSLVEIKKDPRFTKCKFKDHKLNSYMDSEGTKNLERFACSNFEDTKELSLTFFHGKLIVIHATFNLPTATEALGIEFSITNKKADKHMKLYQEKYAAIYGTLTDVCKSVGPFEGKKYMGEGHKSSDGIFSVNIAEFYNKNNKYTCVVMSHKKEQWSEIEKKRYEWGFLQEVFLTDVIEMKRESQESKKLPKKR